MGLVALLPDCASACTCMMMAEGSQQEIAKQALSDSAAVFSGEAVAVEERGLTSTATTTVTIRVSEVWKGPMRGTLEVTTPTDETACGYPFEEGREYLVYAGQGFKEETGRVGRRPSDLKRVDICSETKPLSEAGADLEALGEGERPGDDEPLPDTSGGFPPLGIIGMMGLAVVAVSLVVLMRLVRTS